jgi:hypothetical protein
VCLLLLNDQLNSKALEKPRNSFTRTPQKVFDLAERAMRSL